MLFRRTHSPQRLEEARLALSYISMGIDQSTTATGLIVLEAHPTDKPYVRLTTALCPDPAWTPFRKQRFIVQKMMGYIDKFEPDLVVIEGYGINMRRPGSVIPLVELGGVIRYHLQMRNQLHMAPKPTLLKQFATGKGNSKKPEMAKALAEQYDKRTLTEDEVDAYWLALFGLAFHNKLAHITPQQRAAIGNAERPS